MRVRVSVIIPVWRDERHLQRLLADANLASASEVIIAAPHDEIDELAALIPANQPVRLVASPPGRGRQMNVGASLASGDWLLFLHADSRLPAGWMEDIIAADRDAAVVGGAFRFALDSSDARARAIEWGVRRRVRWFNLPYGDQGLFVRRTAFEALRGYPPLAIMEDVEFVRRLRQHGRLYYSQRPLPTSARRWQSDGWIRRTLTNWGTFVAYSAGISPPLLVRWYERRHADAVAVLARDPQSVGKTRLLRALRTAADPTLLQALLADTLAALEQVAGVDRLLVHTGPRRAIAAFCPSGWTTLPQRGDDLGMRMASAFDDVFCRGHARVVLVGSDLPTLPWRSVRQTFRLLRRDADVVLGPAEDGGFYLIGLRSAQPALFEGIQWGTSHVLQQTSERARALRLAVRLVAPWYDVDDLESLRRAVTDPRAVHTAAWGRAHSLIA